MSNGLRASLVSARVHPEHLRASLARILGSSLLQARGKMDVGKTTMGNITKHQDMNKNVGLCNILLQGRYRQGRMENYKEVQARRIKRGFHHDLRDLP